MAILEAVIFAAKVASIVLLVTAFAYITYRALEDSR